jgi:hypothetical protein
MYQELSTAARTIAKCWNDLEKLHSTAYKHARTSVKDRHKLQQDPRDREYLVEGIKAFCSHLNFLAESSRKARIQECIRDVEFAVRCGKCGVRDVWCGVVWAVYVVYA